MDYSNTIVKLRSRAEPMEDPFIAQAIDLLDKHHAYDTAPAGGSLLDATAGALETYLASGDLEATFVALLPDVLEITGSDFGFLAEVCHSWNQTPYLQSHAVRNIYKSDYTYRDVVSNLQFFNLNTLNGAIIKERAPVVTSDPERDPRSGGLPFGHERLKSYCGLPFLVEDTLVGALALANRPGGYPPNEVEALQPLCAVSGRMISHARNR